MLPARVASSWGATRGEWAPQLSASASGSPGRVILLLAYLLTSCQPLILKAEFSKAGIGPEYELDRRYLSGDDENPTRLV